MPKKNTTKVSHRAKLTAAQARSIFLKYWKHNWTQEELAKHYAVTQPTICGVVNAKNYRSALVGLIESGW